MRWQKKRLDWRQQAAATPIQQLDFAYPKIRAAIARSGKAIE
jgi:hypothetical protein